MRGIGRLDEAVEKFETLSMPNGFAIPRLTHGKGEYSKGPCSKTENAASGLCAFASACFFNIP